VVIFVTVEKLLIERSNGLLLFRTDLTQESQWRYDNCYKFIYSTKGGMHYQTKRSEFTLFEQQFILFNPHDEHKQITVDNQKFLIELNPLFLNHIATSIHSIHYDIQFASCIQKHPQLTHWVQFISEYIHLEKGNNDHSMDVFLEHSFTQLALILVKFGVGTQTQDINLNTIKMMNSQLHKVILGMKEDYRHQWTLEEMANISQLSKYQFAHLFKEIIGISPYSWLQLYRIIRSQEMLIKTNQSILDIALECGFSSISVYNQLFKRLYGVTPGSFRTNVKK
jgi:AraC-like DNA-binding protein